jgi:ribonuclease HI
MLLSIDKVLHLLTEGKDVAKIAELADLESEDVIALLEEARTLLAKHEREKSRRKIIIRKKSHTESDSPRNYHEEPEDDLPSFLGGAELSAVPVEDLLIINIAAVERSGVTGVALVIHDSSDHQVGKLSYCLRRVPARRALIRAAVRSFEIAEYFNAKEVKIRSNDDIFVRQINKEIYIQEADLQSQYDSFNEIATAGNSSYRCELISTLSNDKTTYLAEKAIPARA